MTETYTSTDKTMLYYGLSDGTKKGAHFAFNFNFITSLSKGFDAQGLERCIQEWLDNLPEIYTSNWVVSYRLIKFLNYCMTMACFLVGKPRQS